MTVEMPPKKRNTIIGASLLALFLGALDALIMSAAMPTIVADLGAFHLYSWVYSAYFLARAVSLPIFGKLADLFKNRTLFLISIGLFAASSVLAGCAANMLFLIAARGFQGIGAGGIFALVYIVLSDISPAGRRGKTLSLASSIWGISSLLGPTLGGFIVTYFSWRWIFFINVPLGLAAFLGLGLYLEDLREKRKEVNLDLAGVFTLTVTILGVLTFFLMGGRALDWLSPGMIFIAGVSVAAATGFYFAESRAADPMLPLGFFSRRGFRTGNLATFFSSFTIFSLFAYAPLFLQGALLKSPVDVGLAMLSLSLGWSLGSFMIGQKVHRIGNRTAAVLGAVLLLGGSAMTLGFGMETTMTSCVVVFILAGTGMGGVTLSTLLVVQNSVDGGDLGVATSSHQFARTLGGAVGIGVSGGFVTAELVRAMDSISGMGNAAGLEASLLRTMKHGVESLFQPEIQAVLPAGLKNILGAAVADGVGTVFWIVTGSALICLVCCMLLPGEQS